jgi:Co/Zn/Cd efflux system component
MRHTPHPHDHDHPHDHPHDHNHPHDHAHHHDHDHPHDHAHHHGGGLWGIVRAIFHFHGHGDQRAQQAADLARATETGIRTIWWALAALAITTVLQVFVVWLSGSVALLADTVHNLGDMLNSIPLLSGVDHHALNAHHHQHPGEQPTQPVQASVLT